MKPLQHYFMGAGEKVSAHLAAEECKCHCHRCKSLRIWQVVVPETGYEFEIIRTLCSEEMGKDCPIHTNSGVRCAEHNAEIEDQGAVNDSQHVVGRALDLKKPDGMPLWKFHEICDSRGTKIAVGFYDWGCHIDTRPYPRGRTTPIRWGRKAKCPGK